MWWRSKRQRSTPPSIQHSSNVGAASAVTSQAIPEAGFKKLDMHVPRQRGRWVNQIMDANLDDRAAGRKGCGCGFGLGFGAGLSLGLAFGLRHRFSLPTPAAQGEISPRPLFSRGEPVTVSVDGETWATAYDALLDTGNEARTIISAAFAKRLNLQPSAHGRPFVMKGTNGWSSPYQQCRFRLRIADVETDWIDGAIGGNTTILIGRDVLLPLSREGYTVRTV